MELFWQNLPNYIFTRSTKAFQDFHIPATTQEEKAIHEKIQNISFWKIAKVQHIEFNILRRYGKVLHIKDSTNVYILTHALIYTSGVRICTENLFWNEFPLTNFFLLVSLGKCQVCSIWYGYTYNTHQTYLKRYFLKYISEKVFRKYSFRKDVY